MQRSYYTHEELAERQLAREESLAFLEQHSAKFAAMGKSTRRIRDLELYRAQYGSFREFCLHHYDEWRMSYEDMHQICDDADNWEAGRFDLIVPLPSVPIPEAGEMRIGHFLRDDESVGASIVIEAHPRSPGFCRAAIHLGNELTFQPRGLKNAFQHSWLRAMGVDPRAFDWLPARSATAESNPFSKVLPEWKY